MTRSRPPCAGKALALLAVLLAGPACDDGTTEGANSNTNWLRVCENSADCGGHWDCLCGVCTATCVDRCEAEGGACVAADTLAHDLLCGAEPSALCLRSCVAEDEAACADAEVCVNGACSPKPAEDGCASHPDALFCSSFEGADLAAEAATLLDGGELAHTTERALSGSGALATAVDTDDGRSRARYDIAPQTTGTLYLRAWLYLDIDDTSSLHLHTITVGSVDTATHGTDAHILGGKLGFSFPNAGDVEGRASVPARAWFCVRLEIALGASDGAARIWLNEELSAEVEGADTLPPDGVHNLSVGIDRSERAGVRLLIDDLLLATSPVSCHQPR